MEGILLISVYRFDCKLYIDLLFLLLKIVQLTAFYCKITCNVWLYLLQFSLYIVQELTVNLLTVFFSVAFLHNCTVKLTRIVYRRSEYKDFYESLKITFPNNVLLSQFCGWSKEYCPSFHWREGGVDFCEWFLEWSAELISI